MEELKSLDQILSEIKAGDAGNQGIQKIAPNTGKLNQGVIQDIAYDVPTSAVYDRLSDGSFTPRFENYKGAVGNEDRLANEQTWYEQAGNGLLKNVRKAGNYAIDATVGTAYGAISAVANWDFEKLYDNDFSHTMDDWNMQLDYKLPNYYTDEQKSQGFLSSALTTNFWFNDVAGGLAFVAGALLPEAVKAFVTGGGSVPLALAKYGAKAAFKSGDDLVKMAAREGAQQAIKPSTILGSGVNIVDKVNDFNTFEKGTNFLRSFQRANFLKSSGDALSTGLFLARTSNFEAGMEARHNFKDAMSEYFETFEDKNGRPPSMEEMTAFTDQARIAANGVYGANMAILTVSNAAMFGKTFGIGVKTSKAIRNPLNRAIGLGITKKTTGELALANSTRLQRTAGSIYKILSKPLIEGVYEEGLQGVTGKTMQNYLRAKYDPDQQDGFSSWASLSDAFAQQYGTSEGWKEMGVGLIIGFAGGTIQGHGFEGLGKNSRKATEVKVGEQIEESNRGVETLRNINRASTVRNFRNVIESGADQFKSTSAENTMMNVEFIKSQEHLKSRTEIQQDFDTIVDNMELDLATLDELGTENVETYKSGLKEEFARNVRDYNFARKTVSSLGLDKHINVAGDVYEVGEALTMQLILGKDALSSAKNVASQIEAIVGSGGVFNYMQFYNGLTDEMKASVGELRYKKRRMKQLQDLAIQYGQRSAGAQFENKRNLKPETIERRYKQNAEKLVLTQQEITNLQLDIDNLRASLETDMSSSKFDLDGSSIIDETAPQDVLTVIEELDKLEMYKTSLRKNGREYEAESLDYLTEQFKIFSDTHRELNNTARRMLSTDFFSSEEGKGMIDSIVGKKYQMSEDFRKVLEDNDAVIDQSLGATGQFRGAESVSEYVQRAIEQNPNLSDREKFNLESILRLQLGVQAIQKNLKTITSTDVNYNAEKEGTQSPLEGDTVTLKQRINIQESGMNNVTILNSTIANILSQIDNLRISNYQNSLRGQIEDSNTNRDKLDRTKVEIEFEEGDYMNLLDLVERIRNGQQSQTPEDIQLAGNYPLLLEMLIPENSMSQLLSSQIEEGSTDVKTDAMKFISANIDEMNVTRDTFRIIDSEEYLRLNELTKKQEFEGLSPSEEEEILQLRDDVNQWLMITGSVADGLRLSDLIRQKVILEGTPIEEVPEVASLLPQDILDGIDFGDRTGNMNSSLGQSYDAVTAIGDPRTGNIAISGISPDALMEEVEFEFEFSTNERGNILISPEVQNRINQESNISILPTNQDLTTNYSVVIKHGQNINGDPKSFPLKSNYSDDFTESQNTDAIYSQQPGDPLILEVDPGDEYNVMLLNEYRLALGSENRTEEQLNDLAVQMAKDYIDNDLALTSMSLELTDLKSQVSKAPTTAIKNDLNKKIRNLEKKIGAREDKLTDQAEIDAYTPSPRNQERVEQALEDIKKGAVVRVKDMQGNFLAVLKGKSSSGLKTPEDLKFESFRDQLFSDQTVVDQIAGLNLTEEFNIPGLAVKKVFLGHPNFNFIKNEDGSVGIQYKRLSPADITKVVDLGFVENGTLRTKTRIPGIDTTFLNKFVKTAPPTQKIPFIVFEKEGMRVAYPARVEELPAFDNQEFIDVFNSTASDNNKAASLNKIMASRGIDIKKPGNAFVIIGESNLNEEFFNQRLSQLEDMKYYFDLNTWIDPNSDTEQILSQQVSINIDLSNPLHSPKLQIDFDQVAVEVPIENVSSTQQRKINKSTPNQSALHSILGREIQEDAEDELNEDC